MVSCPSWLTEHCRYKLQVDLGVNSRLLQQHVSRTTGKLLTSSDIHNLKSSVNRQCTDVTSVLMQHTAQYPHDDIGVVVDDTHTVKLIFIQTQQMKETFAKFPEVLLLDGTYSTNNCGMPLYSFLAEDGYGQGQIVGMFLLNGESNDDISSMVEIFRTCNPAVAQTRTVVTDKDFAEISVLEALLPHVSLQLCTFHCIKAVQRKIASLSVSSDVKSEMNTLFRKLLYAKGETDFAEAENEIKDTCQPFHQYLADNWYPLKARWVHYLKNQETNLGNTTTNRIEVQFGKLKQIVKNKVSLSLCLKQLLQFVKSVQMQSSFDRFLVQTKVTYNGLAGTDEGRYFGLCTRYACQKILKRQVKGDRIWSS